MSSRFDAEREIADYFANAGRFAGAADRYVGMAAGGEADELVDFLAQRAADEQLALVRSLARVAVSRERRCFDALSLLLRLVLRGFGDAVRCAQPVLEAELLREDNLADWLAQPDWPAPDDPRMGWRYAAGLIAILSCRGSSRVEAIVATIGASATSQHFRETARRNRGMRV